MRCSPSLSKELFRRAALIRAILFDVDGVMADGSIVYDSERREVKFFDAHDGYGIKLAGEAGMTTGIISARESEAIRHRAAELGVKYLYLGSFDKISAYRAFKKETALTDEQICFVGDDLPDLPVLAQVGLPVAVNNAAGPLKNAVPFSTRCCGGGGALREVIDFVLYAAGLADAQSGQLLPRKGNKK